MRNASEGGKPKGKILLAGIRNRREDNIKLDSKHESHIRCWLTQYLWLMPRRHTLWGFKYCTNPVSLCVYKMNAVHLTAGESNIVFTSTVRLD